MKKRSKIFVIFVIISFISSFKVSGETKKIYATDDLVITNTTEMESNTRNNQEKAQNDPEYLKRKNEMIKMTVLYDNYVYTQGTQAAWGFSCLIETGDKTILFDTGGDSEVLLHNIRQLNVNLSEIDIIVISHNHWDHTGGLFSVLESNNEVPVYLPGSFPQEFVDKVKDFKAEVVLVNEPVDICENIMSTGEMKGPVNEQALIVKTSKGTVVVTGCSHPGIVEIVKKAEEISGEKIYMVFGGFHLMRHSESAVRDIITEFRELGVKKCGATHCTGDQQIKMFKDAYGDDYIGIGTGQVLEF